MTAESNRQRKGRKVLRTARDAVRRSYEVEYIPESNTSPSPLDILVQKLLNNRGKVYVLMEKTDRKKTSAHSFVRRMRRRAEEGGVGQLINVVSRTFWNEGLVRVFASALTEAQYKEKYRERRDDPSDRSEEAP